ncbi:hypothetical protein HDU87_008499 [Geranomyces variabilis]|uniref:Nitrogen regulatory protein areA GATA-like domain-containing protein n=1 Tax=Geranomyces variabilis TaxID=109894 RepID=A0AAD5TRG2_9FUNG|nr:hypothetical protein HDU87_008499 [Geranomyces variabilis]
MPISLAEPVLTLAFNNIQKLTTIDEDDIQAIWNVFTKCKDNLENGRRLENISWRLWYRSCHGHSPEDDDEETSALDIPNAAARHQKHNKPAHVSPESFNRILKNAVEDSGGSGGRRAVPTELLALKNAAAASICIKQRKQQQQQAVEIVVVPVAEAPTSALPSPPSSSTEEVVIAPAAVAPAPPTPVLAALATIPDVDYPPVSEQSPAHAQPHQQQPSAKVHHAAPPPPAPAPPTSAAVPRVASALALNHTLQQLLPRNYTAIPRTASAVALNQMRLLAPGSRNASAVTLNHYAGAVTGGVPAGGGGGGGGVDGPVRRTASGQPLVQYAAPHAPTAVMPQYAQPMYAPQPLYAQQQQQQPPQQQPPLQRYQHLGQQHPQQQPQRPPPNLQRAQPPTQTLLHPPVPQRSQQQQQQPQGQHYPVPSKVKFFISESLTPDPALRHLPPRRQPLATTDQCTATRMTPPPPSAAPARFYTMDSDSCSDSDYSSDFSDSEDDSDSYSDDDEDDDVGGSSVATYTPPPMFQKVSLPESGTICSNSGASSCVSMDGTGAPAVLTSRRSLLSVAIQQGAALKRAKPSQFRNLSAMGVDEESGNAGNYNNASSSNSNMQDSDSESLCDEMSQSLKENLVCERRMMPHNMRYARATSLSEASSLINATANTTLAHGVYGDEGYW